MIEPRLPYNYAILDENNCCVGCRTYSYNIPLENYIPISSLNYDYLGKYYKEGLWYTDSEFTILADGLN